MTGFLDPESSECQFCCKKWPFCVLGPWDYLSGWNSDFCFQVRYMELLRWGPSDDYSYRRTPRYNMTTTATATAWSEGIIQISCRSLTTTAESRESWAAGVTLILLTAHAVGRRSRSSQTVEWLIEPEFQPLPWSPHSGNSKRNLCVFFCWATRYMTFSCTPGHKHGMPRFFFVCVRHTELLKWGDPEGKTK